MAKEIIANTLPVQGEESYVGGESDEYLFEAVTYSDLMDEIRAMEDHTDFVTVKTKELLAEEYSMATMGAFEAEDDVRAIGYSVLPSGIVCKTGDEYEFVRPMALASMKAAAKIDGTALDRMSPEDFILVINKALSVARSGDETLLLRRGGLITAFLSGNEGGYEYMPISGLLEDVKNAMNKFGDCEFVRGTNGNGFTMAEFELPDLVEQVNDDYAEAVKKAGISMNRYNSEEFMPAIVFASSDAGFCAASVYPVMKTTKGARIRVGQPLKADHLKGRSNAGYAYFAAELPKVFAKFDDFAGSVAKMAGVMINYPKNAFINMCKAAKVPKKRAAAALENMLNIAGDSPMTMDDLYLFIMDIAAEAANEMEPSALIRLEDSLAKIAKMNWSEYDLVIDATW